MTLQSLQRRMKSCVVTLSAVVGFLVFLSHFSVAVAETTVSGVIATDMTWTLAGSPYIVTADVTVQGADGADGITTLTIEPGVEVRFAGIFMLKVGYTSGNPGALVAQGTAENPILFTSNQATPAPGDWSGVWFYTTADDATSILDHCIIDYAGNSYGALLFSSASPTIQNTEVKNSKNYAVYSYYSGPILNGNTFTSSGNYDLYYTGTSTGSITNNIINNGIDLPDNTISEISGNTINCNPAYPSKIPANDVGRVLASTLTNTAGNYLNVNTGIITTDATWPAKLPLHILGNITVQGVDGADGITTLTIEPGVEVRFNLYTQLIIGASSGAPGSLVAQGTIGNPILFTSNQVTPAPGNWYGVRFHATSPTSSILENAIVEYANYNIVVSATSPTILNTKSRFASIAGVYLYGAATTSAILGCLDISDNAYGFHVSYANPIISGHNIVNNSSAGLYVFGSNIDDATNNWWGDAGGPGVNGANIVTGTATVAPWLTAAKSCDQVINEPPETPHTPQPSDVSVRVPLASGNVTLSWLTTDPNTGDTVFSDIYMGADPESLSLLTGGLATKSYTTPLAEGMTYYWQVVAKDYEFSSSGPIWSFTTDGPPPDLIVNSFTSQPQGNVNVGDTITFTATITNQGAGPVVDSSTMELGMDGVAIAIDNIDTILMNGATVQISGTWVYAIGDHTLSATVDPLDTVVEADEANNSLSMTVADLLDQEPPQLISTLPVANSYAQQAETFTFTLYDRHRHIDDAAVIAAFSLIGPGSLPVPGTISENNDTFIFTPAGSFAQGTYNATILAQDIVGYIVNYQIPFVLDGVPPEPPVITGGTMASGLVQIRPVLNSAEALSFTLTGEREADTSVFIDSVEQIPLGQDILWSSVLFLTPGPNSFAVRLRDAAGNLSDEVWVDIIAESTDRLEMLYDASGRIKQIVKP